MEKRILVWIVLFFGGIASVLACNYTYTLHDAHGGTRQITEGEPVVLQAGAQYTLEMVYVENHRNCTVSPDETLYLLDGSRWRVARDTQPLVLAALPEWTAPARRTHAGTFPFAAQTPGVWALEVVRVCDRGGYHGTLIFEVRS